VEAVVEQQELVEVLVVALTTTHLVELELLVKVLMVVLFLLKSILALEAEVLVALELMEMQATKEQMVALVYKQTLLEQTLIMAAAEAALVLMLAELVEVVVVAMVEKKTLPHQVAQEILVVAVVLLLDGSEQVGVVLE
jgi:hypothetical protein